MTGRSVVESRLYGDAFSSYPQYRDSGVEWLGEIPAHWGVERLKYIAPESRERLDAKPNDLAYLGLENIESQTGRLLLDAPIENVESTVVSFRAGDILFGKLRPYLAKVVKVDFAGVGTTEILVLRPASETDGRYVFYHLLAEGFIASVNALTYGTKMPRANSEQIANMRGCLPPLAEQRAIAALLDRETAKLDALIAKKERLLALLAEKRAALISHAVTKGLDPSVPMRDSGAAWLGEIPAHWEVKRLKFLASRMTAGPFGSSLTKDLYTQSGYRVYGQEQVIPGDFTIGDYYIAEELYRLMSQYAVAPGDVLISCVGTFGRVAVVPLDAEPGVINPRLIKVTPDRSLIVPEYLGVVLRSGVSYGQFEQASRGGTMGVINLGLISEILVPVPPLSEQQAILEELDSTARRLDSLLAKVRAAIEKLRGFRAALISAAVTGKIDVRKNSEA